MGFITSGMVDEEFGINKTHSWLNLDFPKTHIKKNNLWAATKTSSSSTTTALYPRFNHYTLFVIGSICSFLFLKKRQTCASHTTFKSESNGSTKMSYLFSLRLPLHCLVLFPWQDTQTAAKTQMWCQQPSHYHQRRKNCVDPSSSN